MWSSAFLSIFINKLGKYVWKIISSRKLLLRLWKVLWAGTSYFIGMHHYIIDHIPRMDYFCHLSICRTKNIWEIEIISKCVITDLIYRVGLLDMEVLGSNLHPSAGGWCDDAVNGKTTAPLPIKYDLSEHF